MIVEDDNGLREALTEHLVETGELSSVGAGTFAGAALLLRADPVPFDLMVLDVHLPDGNGFGFRSQLRDQGHTIPIIMLSGSATASDVRRGLETNAGADLRKPFRAGEPITESHAAACLFPKVGSTKAGSTSTPQLSYIV